VSVFRRFIDAAGVAWQVFELGARTPSLPADVKPRDREGRLYFLGRGTTRVLQGYPSDWSILTWEELAALKRRAEVLGADRPFLESAADDVAFAHTSR
jgi:hypothetical protein